MNWKNKYFYPITSNADIIKVVWFLNQKLKLNLTQIKKFSPLLKKEIVYFEDTTSDFRTALFNLKDINIKKLQKTDFILISESKKITKINALLNSPYINFIFELNLEILPQKDKNKLLSL